MKRTSVTAVVDCLGALSTKVHEIEQMPAGALRLAEESILEVGNRCLKYSSNKCRFFGTQSGAHRGALRPVMLEGAESAGMKRKADCAFEEAQAIANTEMPEANRPEPADPRGHAAHQVGMRCFSWANRVVLSILMKHRSSCRYFHKVTD